MTGLSEHHVELRVSDADRNGTLRRLHNAVALGLIDIDEFEERSALVSQARLHSDLDTLVGDLPGPGAIVTSATDRVELRGVMGSLKRQGEWTVPTRLALHRRMGSVELDLTRARFAGPMIIIELDMKFGGLELRLPDGASASIDGVEVAVCGGGRTRPAAGTTRRDGAGRFAGGAHDLLAFMGTKGLWRRLVAHLVRIEGVRGSNPLSSTPSSDAVGACSPGGVAAF